MPPSELHEPVLTWYFQHARDLPWRAPDASPWAVLVSEVMLQQTPVTRVLPVYQRWIHAWPRPADLAAAEPGDAVRGWGRLGYPRRALRLHQAAAAMVERHDGEVPSSYDELLALPGIGSYTAAAVASFAFGQRHAVLDTNVRRVLARAAGGVEQPAPSLTAGERQQAAALLPAEPATAATGQSLSWSSAPWSAPREAPLAPGAPSRRGAPGTQQENLPTLDRVAAPSGTSAPTGRSEAWCCHCFATH